MFCRCAEIVFVLLFLLPFDSSSQAVESKKKTLKEVLNPTALFEWETAFVFEESEIQKTEFIFKPEFNIKLNKNVRWVILGRLYSEVTDNLEPAEPNQSEVSDFSKRWIVGDRFEAELREFYFDIKIKKTFLTIGKQQIVWGKADGLRIMDLVNPFNFREFLLDEFEDSRIPLWSIKADILIKSITAQIVWIPDQSYNDFPDVGATYSFRSSFPAGIEIRQNPVNKPDHFIQDADIGLRLSTFFKGWDLTVNYLYFHDDTPATFSSLETNSVLTLSPEYKRNHLIGTTFSNAFGSFTMRGEVGYILDKYFTSSDVNQGVFKSNELMAVAGLDYTGISNTNISTQIFVDRISKNNQLIGRDDFESNFSLLVSRNFMNETLTTDIIGVQNLNRGEGFIQAKVKYLLRSNLTIWAGGETIYGNANSFIGQFRNQDRVYVGMELGL